MNQKRFSVYFSKKETIGIILGLSFFLIGCGIAIFIPELKLLGILGVSIYSVIMVFAILVSVMFRIDVNYSKLEIRTRLGKQLQFECSDIEKVVCSKRDSVKFGPQFYIKINFTTYDVRLNAGMVGFEEMAGYLLEKYESGEIKESAISKSCKKTLANHRDYVHTKNLKKKK